MSYIRWLSYTSWLSLFRCGHVSPNAYPGLYAAVARDMTIRRNGNGAFTIFYKDKVFGWALGERGMSAIYYHTIEEARAGKLKAIQCKYDDLVEFRETAKAETFTIVE